jgi:RNA polymerase-binding transcription factor DksA
MATKTKKTSKPAAKKIVAKKSVTKKTAVKKAVPAKKVAVKKPAPKITVKSAKKAAVKKPALKAAVKSAKKVVSKSIAKPKVAKKPVKKVVSKLITKPKVAKKPAEKVVSKSIAKPEAAKKPASKVAAKPVVKTAAKSVVKTAAKPVVKTAAKPVKKVVARKPSPVKTLSGKPIVKSTLKIISERATLLKDQIRNSAQELIKEGKERLRYSDKELAEFKAIIEEKLKTARHNLIVLKEAYANMGENDINDTSPSFKVLEEGYQVLSKEENAQLAARQQKFISALEAALVRIANKTYGICRETGKLIDKERLKIVPHATLSIEAKRDQNKK